MLDYVREKILPYLAQAAVGLTPGDIWTLRSYLHALHHYAAQGQLSAETTQHINNALSTTGGLWQLLSENELTATDLKDYTRVRTLSAEAEGLANLEELISGEDTLRDVIINAVVFMLNWRSNSIWIDSAKRTRKAMTQNYALEIQDAIWAFIKESASGSDALDLQRAESIRERTERLLRLITGGELPIEGQVALLIQIYLMLLRLQVGRLIIGLEEIARQDEA